MLWLGLQCLQGSLGIGNKYPMAFLLSQWSPEYTRLSLMETRESGSWRMFKCFVILTWKLWVSCVRGHLLICIFLSKKLAEVELELDCQYHGRQLNKPDRNNRSTPGIPSLNPYWVKWKIINFAIVYYERDTSAFTKLTWKGTWPTQCNVWAQMGCCEWCSQGMFSVWVWAGTHSTQ